MSWGFNEQDTQVMSEVGDLNAQIHVDLRFLLTETGPRMIR